MAPGADDPKDRADRTNDGTAATIARGAGGAPTMHEPPARESQRMLVRWGPGDSIGRFVVLEPLGAGGMGVVLLAYDPQLDRKIAIKVVRPELAGEGTAAVRTRLLREAQAMAKLTHPNVIVVYEFGAIEDDVFIAMEFVDGGTLAQWLREPRSWNERLAILVEAGRGLAAAHHAGLVHRDFKPDNVLVGRNGRVRVTDFGLVGGIEGAVATRPDMESAVSDQLTRTGAVMGTPSYMAPEQFAGGDVDARADQFAFCVTVYEALFGKRPFTGSTFRELMDNVRGGHVAPIGKASAIPAAIRSAIMRGLSSDANARFESMDALLNKLENAVAGERKVRFGLPPGAGVAKVRRDASLLATYLREHHDIHIEPVLAADYRELVNAIVEQRVDLAWLPPLVFAEASTHGVRPLALLRRAASEGYRGVLIVRSDSGITTIDQLEGRRIAWVDQESASGHLLPRSLIADRRTDVDAFLGPQQFLGSHKNVVEAVLHGMVDCGATFAHLGADGSLFRSGWQQYLGERAKELVAIAFSTEIPSDAIGVRAGFDEPSCATVLAGFRAMLASADGRDVLDLVFNQLESFDEPTPEFDRRAASMLRFTNPRVTHG